MIRSKGKGGVVVTCKLCGNKPIGNVPNNIVFMCSVCCQKKWFNKIQKLKNAYYNGRLVSGSNGRCRNVK